MFSHESGIHVDGLLKDRRNYETFAPEELGRQHRLVLGKHSGSAGLLSAYQRLGLAVTPEQVAPLLERVRAHVMHTKGEPSDDALRRFHLETCTSGPRPVATAIATPLPASPSSCRGERSWTA